jgi:hypothetical protein
MAQKIKQQVDDVKIRFQSFTLNDNATLDLHHKSNAGIPLQVQSNIVIQCKVMLD